MSLIEIHFKVLDLMVTLHSMSQDHHLCPELASSHLLWTLYLLMQDSSVVMLVKFQRLPLLLE